ncbi:MULTISPECIES: PqqD family protein [Bacillus cereus group]|uniref:PqqD family protein n=1 Tax=Bacillus cereus group TaxID=86661 RepID=UPI000BECD94A|nr:MULTISPECIES: PqqD family protein [Bacillus cereus group]MBJ8078166.1 PqqD family protein [Bacillus cereus group sp. N12]MED1014678.1 PqqD family protein [Bacillus mycoides]MED1024337.1 PqqD family protein [Bacillus mycoides]MED1054642.1 PqqD family protein [Bacillus mycoides]PDY87612.1 hypothetical protein CON67_21670 [Bacillus toyonensis]
MNKVAQNIFATYRVLNDSAYVLLKDDAFKLDEVGQLVWEKIGSGNSIENVVNSIKSHYKVENIEDEIKAFIEDLLKNELIEEIA